MTVIASALRQKVQASSRFCTLDIGEPISVRLAYYPALVELRHALKELSPSPTPLTVVVQLPARIGREEFLALLDLTTARARRVVLIAQAGTLPFLSKLEQLAVQFQWPCPVQLEPEAERAVIGAMQSLQAGEAMALLWPEESGLTDPALLVAQGARWRAAWEAPEEGEFHPLPS